MSPAAARHSTPPAVPPRPTHRVPLARPSAPRSPRRVSGPARPAAPRPASALRGAAPAPSLAARVAGALSSLADHRLLDRAVRGRVWIGLLGVLLTGIVAVQVELLKLSSGVGQNTLKAAQLQGVDDRLRAEVARLSDEGRIESLAASRGLIMPNPANVRFLARGSGAQLRQALAAIRSPAAASEATRPDSAANG